MARRYGIGKISDIFNDDELWETVKNPYRRALLMALISEVKTEEYAIGEILNKHIPEYLKNLINISTCTLVNMFKDSKSPPVKSIFQETKKPDTKITENTLSVNLVPGKKVQRIR